MRYLVSREIENLHSLCFVFFLFYSSMVCLVNAVSREENEGNWEKCEKDFLVGAAAAILFAINLNYFSFHLILALTASQQQQNICAVWQWLSMNWYPSTHIVMHTAKLSGWWLQAFPFAWDRRILMKQIFISYQQQQFGYVAL